VIFTVSNWDGGHSRLGPFGMRSLARIGCWLRRIVHQGETYLVDQHAHNRSGMVMPMLTSGWDLQFPKPWP
jgi:hypothetical protein